MYVYMYICMYVDVLTVTRKSPKLVYQLSDFSFVCKNVYNMHICRNAQERAHTATHAGTHRHKTHSYMHR
jgi:hypothetical protein